MVRLVFRPYTQLRRSICTSESLRSSIRVSPDFNLARHSSPSFGSQHLCSAYSQLHRPPNQMINCLKPGPQSAFREPAEAPKVGCGGTLVSSVLHRPPNQMINRLKPGPQNVYSNLYSQAVTHPSTNRSQPWPLGRELVYSR